MTRKKKHYHKKNKNKDIVQNVSQKSKDQNAASSDQDKSKETARAPLKSKIKKRGFAIAAAVAVFIVTGIIAISNWGESDFFSNLFSSKSSSTVERIPFPVLEMVSHEDIVKFEDFLGSEACSSCHADIYNLWKESTHGKAGGSPESVNIIGNFDGKERVFKDAVLTPFVSDKGNYMFNLKAEGLPEKTFKVDGVVGGGHMIGGGTQSYFSKFPDGTIRMLPYDFHFKEQVWFGESSEGKGWVPISEDRPIDKLSEWLPTRIMGANIMMINCQECHGSQIQLEFDFDNKVYSTKYKSLDINCESCHGPGKKHVEIMNSEDWESLPDIGMAALATLDKDQSLMVCFKCHASKDILEPGYLPGKDLETHYGLKFPILSSDPYHPDGRVRRFAYQQNHVSSDCYLNGSMTCVDCHDPHSQSYRDINRVQLSDPFDDGQCTSCHASKALNPMKHSFHTEDSPGNKCVSCHMPYLQQQAVGDKLRYARSDHVIPIPRPEFDAGLGIKNACQQCHEDKTIEWLQAKTDEWYGTTKPHNQVVSNLLKAQDGMSQDDAVLLLLNTDVENPIGQMTGLSDFALGYLSPDMDFLEPEAVDKIMEFIECNDIDLKSMAFASLHLAKDNDAEIHNYLVAKLENLDDSEEMKVRTRWAYALPFLAKKFQDTGDFASALSIYKKALEIQPDNIANLVNLGTTYQMLGDIDSAIKSYSDAIRVDQNNQLAWLSLCDILRVTEDDARAFTCYKRARDINPWTFAPHFHLGNYYYKINDNKSAIDSYKKAIEVSPREAIGYFYLAGAYIKEKDYQSAFKTVNAGLSLDPNDEAGKQMLKLIQDNI